MGTRTFRVEGMTCASCVARVERAIKAVPGVSGVQVNLATEEARIVVTDATDLALVTAVQARGYRLIPAQEIVDDTVAVRHALWRVLIAWLLTLPLMVGMVPGLHWHLPWPIQMTLSALAAFGAGSGFFVRALRQAAKLESSMDTLIALGALLTWGFAIHEGMQGAMHPPFEGAAALVAFLLTGKYLEVKAKHRATDSLGALLHLAPGVALRVGQDGVEQEIASSQVRPGDVVRIKPGHAAPVDGVVVAGTADLEEALLTGEPLPVPKGVGDKVMAGALVHGGVLDVQATSTGLDTWLARLAAQVAEAQGSRAPVQDLADRVSAVFVPVILVLAVLTLAGWWLTTGSLDLAWRPAVTLLVIACPCALGLATPVAMAAALGTAARNGLFVRNAAAMEALARMTDLAFDKTGTLTKGRPALQQIHGEHPDEVLTLAAALEQGSEHPVARGILAAAKGQILPAVQDFRSIVGLGVQGLVAGRHLKLGNAAFLGMPLHDVPDHAVAVGLAQGDTLLGTLVLADTLRPEAKSAVARLQKQGLRLHLLSGDRAQAALDLGREVGIADAHGACTPEGKRTQIQALQAKGAVVAFVGDGVNDALALAQADAGISLPGLAAAQVAAPLNLLREGLEPLMLARRLAVRTRSVIRQNLAWAFGYNLVLVPLAAFGALDRFGGPMLAGAAMGLSSLTVVVNALRLRRP